MRVSVAICTWNRARLLDQTLANLRNLVVPAGVEWELLVVDNNCTDDTGEVLARHAPHLPLRWISEPRRGLSHARNAAVGAVEGDFMLWTDDDVLVDPHWLAEYVTAARAWPAASFFGGPIEPWFETPPPPWVTAAWQRVCCVYAVRDWGNQAFEYDATSLPYGANYAVRTEVQRRYRYDPHVGRTGQDLMSAEEYMLLRQMLIDGHRGRFLPGPRVRHFIPSDRLNLEYVQRWFFGLGQTHARLFPPPKLLRHFGGRTLVRIWMGCHRIHAEIGYRWTRRWAKPQQWVWYAAEASYWQGRQASPS